MDEKGNKSHTSITFIQHSLKRHSPFRPAGSLWNAAIVMLSDRCMLRVDYLRIDMNHHKFVNHK